MNSIYIMKKTVKKSKRKWSNKYKKSINCKRPKGFSQKQYCKYGRKKTHGGGIPLERATSLKRKDNTDIRLNLASFHRFEHIIKVKKNYRESEYNYSDDFYNMYALEIRKESCEYPIYIYTQNSVLLIKTTDTQYYLTSITDIEESHLNSAINYLKNTLHLKTLDDANITFIDMNDLDCKAPFKLLGPSRELNMFNNLLQSKCTNLLIEINPCYNLTANNVNTYRSCSRQPHSSVLFCLTNTATSECVASVELFKPILSSDETEVVINSYTSPNHQGKGYNKLLRAAVIYFVNSVFKEAQTLTSEADNPISAKVMMQTFGSTGYNSKGKRIKIKGDNYDDVFHTALQLNLNTKKLALDVFTSIINEKSSENLC
jgi:hypothetical protein